MGLCEALCSFNDESRWFKEKSRIFAPIYNPLMHKFMSVESLSSYAATFFTSHTQMALRPCSMSSAVVGLVRCLTLVLMLLPCAAIADEKGDLLLEQADSLYGAQQYKEALEAAHEALPLTKGTESEADCLNLLAITNIRLSDYEEAARYAKECYAIDEQALWYIERAYEIDKQLGNEPRAMVRLAQKASVLVGKHAYEEAESPHF